MSDKAVDSWLNRTVCLGPGKNKSGCPGDDEMAVYVYGVISGQAEGEEIAQHINECELCFSKAASAVSALMSFQGDRGPRVKEASIEKAKSIPKLYRRKKEKNMKRHLSLFIAAGFFILSFIFSKHFAQFLAAAVIFGFKWVMDTGGSKALIMIYDAWQQKKDTIRNKRI